MGADAYRQAMNGGALAIEIDEEPSLFWMVTSMNEDRELIVSHADYHLRPEAVQMCGARVVGANEWLVSVTHGEVAWRLRLPCRFYSFVNGDSQSFVVQHEIGFMKVGWDGKVIIDEITGLISSFELHGDTLTYQTLEGACGKIRL